MERRDAPVRAHPTFRRLRNSGAQSANPPSYAGMPSPKSYGLHGSRTELVCKSSGRVRRELGPEISSEILAP